VREPQGLASVSKLPASERLEEEPSSSSSSAPAQAWAPDWATPELQASQLSELEQLIAEESLHLLEVDCGAVDDLRSAQARGEVLLREGPVLCEVPLGDDITARLAVPPFYPTQPVTVVQITDSASGTASRSPVGALRALEREARTEASRLEDACEAFALTALVRWLSLEAPQRWPVLAAEARAAERQACAEAAEIARKAERASKEDRDAGGEASRVRVAEKYSPSWDLCTAFVKHGKCKNKNCKWRHEKPAEKAREETQAGAATNGAQPQAAKGSKAKK